MNKQEFLEKLHTSLSGLPKDNVDEQMIFYSEMIDDRVEDGLSEEAVSAIGNIDGITAQIIEEIPLKKIAKEKIKPKRRLKVWEIIFLAIGSPIWFSILVAFFAVFLLLYVSLWAVLISLWAVFVSVIACALSGVATGIGFAFTNIFAGIALIGAGLVCAGLSVFLFYGCKMATKGSLLLTKKISYAIKNCFIKKEGA